MYYMKNGVVLLPVLALTFVSCKTETKDFGIFAQSESFSAKSVVTTTTSVARPFDMLWIVDNSGSMSDNQTKLAEGFQNFANTYLNDTIDLRLFVITSDTYLAATNASYSSYTSMVAGVSPHDGRRPGSGGVRSGRPLLSTKDESDFPKLISDFQINAKPGTSGSGTEKGMQSVLEFLNRNEQSVTCSANNPDLSQCFFRKNSTRILAFVSDERDSSICPDTGTRDASCFKNNFDTIFKAINEPGNNDANYIVLSIVSPQTPPASWGSSQASWENTYWGKEYLELKDALLADSSNSMAQYSDWLDIGSANYDALLSSVGRTIQSNNTVIVERATFTLSGTPSSCSLTTVTLRSAGTVTVLTPCTDFQVEGNLLLVTPSLITGLDQDATIDVVYEPKPL